MNGRRSCALALACLAGVAAACTGGSSPHPAGPTAPVESTRCVVHTGALPGWARSGFTPSDQALPHVVGEHDKIVGVVFGYPLRSPARPGRANKILWVPRSAAQHDPLKIKAALIGSSRHASRQVDDGPGPSIIDMPAPGCWIFSLSWSGHTDQVAVPYDPK